MTPAALPETVKRANTAVVSWSRTESILLPPVPSCPECPPGNPRPLAFNGATLRRRHDTPGVVTVHVYGDEVPEDTREDGPAHPIRPAHTRLVLDPGDLPLWAPPALAEILAAYLPPLPTDSPEAADAYRGGVSSIRSARLASVIHSTHAEWPTGAPVLVPRGEEPGELFRPHHLTVVAAYTHGTGRRGCYRVTFEEDTARSAAPGCYQFTTGPGPELAAELLAVPADVLALAFAYLPTPIPSAAYAPAPLVTRGGNK